ncbi:MAG: diadenylate cyclase CdaA [Candidatus Omnitrophica bacterium]|nr:diadenylate cyclase CdaA [Candidatus Omnitrophota bacterium]
MDNIYLWKAIFEILILWFVIYHIMLFFEGSGTIQLLRGIILLLLAFYLFQKLDFVVLDWLMTKLLAVSVLAIIVIFYPEIRQGLARLGQRHLFVPPLKEEEIDIMFHEIIKSMENLSKEKFGAMIAVEKNDSLSGYARTGETVDGKLSSDLLQAIFTPNNPLHDGSVIIQQGRIAAAGCIFPISQKQDLSRIFGMRHRAALGLSEETDSLIFVVSEERQDISLAYRGRLYKDLPDGELFAKAKDIMLKERAHA